MKILGITGGVGAGKSTILAYLQERYKAELILCDDVARSLQARGGACYAPLTALLQKAGVDAVDADGELNRRKMAAAFFADKALLAKVNALIHPAVKAEVKRQVAEAEKAGKALVVIEAALLIEEHYEEICDELWYIDTDKEVRIARLAASRGYTRAKSEQIMAAQKEDAYYRAHTDLTIDNSSTDVQNTYKQIDEGLRTHGFM